uniref:Uncharacterized protein n=1 Tax=Anopheles coluzzii TaxID=1518534 RepID=A0A8W7P2T4_ANOCL
MRNRVTGLAESVGDGRAKSSPVSGLHKYVLMEAAHAVCERSLHNRPRATDGAFRFARSSGQRFDLSMHHLDSVSRAVPGAAHKCCFLCVIAANKSSAQSPGPATTVSAKRAARKPHTRKRLMGGKFILI